MSIPHLTLALAAALGVGSWLAAADDASAGNKPGGPDPAAMELMKPGPEHQQLATAVGTWDVASTFWMQPGSPPSESKGTATFRTIFDGRFVQEDYKGEWMGHPFTGLCLIGFDRAARQYVSAWLDSMGTSITTVAGTSSDGGKTIAWHGSMTCPEDGKMARLRQIETHQSPDRFTFEMYVTRDGKEEVKTMELVYNRRK